MSGKRIRFGSTVLLNVESVTRRGTMKMLKRLVFVSLISLFFVFVGCGTYGKLRLQSGPGETMTIHQLEENWEKYNILFTGVEPNVPSAIIFGRKDDDRIIIGERWWNLKDQKTLSETIGRIEAQTPFGPYYPRLWKMLGPDDHLYGYMFTAWDSAVMTIVEGKNMKVHDLPMPPFLAVGGGGDLRSRQ
jgi:hypothetical protein